MKWESADLISTNISPLLADLDRDCIPEIICVSNTLDHILIIDSKTGKTKSKFPTLFINDFVNLLIADIDNDCNKEILFTTPNIDDEFPNNNYKIVCYSSTGRLIWVSDQSFYGKDIGQKLPSLAIADFNQDGIAEVYCYNRIFNARTGVFLASGAPLDGLGYNWINTLFGYHQTIAAQLDQDLNDLELAAGFTVYKVKIINPNSSIGNTLTSLNIQVNNQYLDGKTAIADINQDGQLDIIVSYNSKQNTSLIYVYTIVNNNPKLLAKTINSPINTFISCTTISDINGDGRPDILITQDSSIDCYNYDGSDTLKLLWTYKFNEIDATTAITTFDFNHDGRNEIVHRGNDSIYLLDGSTNPPRIISSSICSAFTVFKNCIVADIDHTGSSKICIPCASENSRYSLKGRLTVFGPPNGAPPWAPARPIWNQFAYNPLYINDDLTVPRVQKNQATYKNGKYNNFMQQESYVDSNGMVKKPAANLSGRISCINYDVKSMRYSVIFDVYNRKDASQIGDTNLLISFYSGDPNTNGTYIGTYKTDQIINAGDSLLNLVFWFQFKDLKDLFMVINTQRVNNGNLEDKDFIQAECDYTDNVYHTIDSPKFDTLNVEICPGEKYKFYNSVVSNIGQYHHVETSSKNCDSLISILNLTYKINCGLNCNNFDTSKCFVSKLFIKPSIKLEKKFDSKDTTSTYFTPTLADMDNDCIPELILIEKSGKKILFIDSKTGLTKKQINTPIIDIGLTGLTLADIDFDGIPEIFFEISPFENNSNIQGRLACYNADGTERWISNKRIDIYKIIRDQFTGTPSLADFNQDGIPEIYDNNKIFNAQTGKLLIDGGANGIGLAYSSGFNIDVLSVAGQLDSNINDLELAAGYTIYKIKISNFNDTTGNRMTPINILVNNEYIDGFTSIADVNNDKILDVVISSPGNNNKAILYSYCLKNDTPELISIAYPSNNQNPSIGPAIIGRIQNSIYPSIIISRFKRLYSYTYNNSNDFTFDWEIITSDSSGGTSASLFDLNNDGFEEIIYRDEKELQIFECSQNFPKLVSNFKCISATSNEHPIVGDIDNSGQAKICVTCSNEKSRENGYLTVFGSPDTLPGWAPARGIWNQYAYNPLYINDDLTVPRVQKNQATYQNGKYNNFMQQESYVDSNGMVKKPAASLTGRISCINYDVKSMRYSVIFDVYNRKDASQIGDTGLLISFYSGDPNTNGTYIGTYKTDQIINAGDSLLNLVYWFQFKDLKDLFMVINTQRVNNGNLEDKDFIQAECDYTDNVFRTIDIPQIESQSASICKGDTYSFFNQFIIDSGTYEHKIYKWNGCDSLITVLDLRAVDTVVAKQSINTCDSYIWNGKKYTNSGIYTYDTLSTNGCDSSTILDLTLHLSDQKNTALISCDSANWNGITYRISGTYEDRRINLAGCDSINILQLTIHPSSNIIQSQSACDHYDWNGQTYSQSGSYFFNTKSVFGCDSNLTLQLTIDTVIQIDLNHTACNSYVWNNNTYTQSGKYQSKEQSQQGCDSITTLNLIIHPSTSSITSVRSCDNYTWNGITYSVSGTYSYQTQNSLGCDSIATLNLIIDKTSSSTSVQRVCDSIIWNGSTYYKSGIYSFKTLNNAGCDSIATLDLTISTPSLEIISKTTCDSINWNGKKYSQSGLYDFKSLNQSGCDSTVRLDLTLNKSVTSDLKLNVCDSILFMGRILNKTGFYTFDTVTSRGCDSAIHVQLSILSNTSSQKVSSCDSFMWNGKTYLQSGIYSEKYTNSLGCDSSFLLDLSIHPSFELKQSIDVCKEYFWPITKTLYTKSEDLLYSLKTAESCDSVYKLQLTIHPEFEKRDTIITNKEYTWPVNKTTYQQSGNYESDFISEAGCDSLHYLVLIINKDVRIYYPNIFNPNSSTNNKFTIFVYGTEAIIEELSIYDRWGELIWQKDNFPTNDINLGWDGIFHGKKVNPGVYVWKALIRVGDGSVLRERGDVTVVR